MSMPSNSPESVVISYGGKAALVDMISLPGSTVDSSAVSVSLAASEEAASEDAASLEAVSEEAASEDAAEEAVEPQAARLRTKAAAVIKDNAFFITIYLLCSWFSDFQGVSENKENDGQFANTSRM